MKRLLCLLTLLLLPLHVLAADNSHHMIAYTGDENALNWNENQFFQRMEAQTGLHFEITQYNGKGDYRTALSQLGEGNAPTDLVFNAGLASHELEALYQQGKILDLSPYIERCMPNLNALLKEHDEIRERITVNGRILSLPHINFCPPQNYMWINKNWLDALKLNIPNNSEELAAVLRAFKTQDPNRNGQQDEIPLSFMGIWDLNVLSHGFGIIADDFHLYEESGVHFAPMEDKYYTFIAYLRMLYAEGLLDKDGFSPLIKLSADEKTPKINKYGILIAPTPFQSLPKALGEEYILLPPLVYEDRAVYRRLIDIAIPGALLVTSQAKNAEQLLSWADYLYSEEGGKLLTIGKEGEEYKRFEDGTWDWIDGSPDNLKRILAESTLNIKGFLPYLEPFDFQKKFDDTSARSILEQIEHFTQYLVSPMPYVYLNAEEAAKIQALHQPLGKYTDETLSRFILDEIALNDDSWQAYKNELKRLGVDKYIRFWQEKLSK